jgi:probable phosphoglycerate mutase
MDDQASDGPGHEVVLESRDGPQLAFPPPGMDNDPGGTDPTADGGEVALPGPTPDRRLAGWNQPASAPTTTFLLRHGQSTLSVDKRFNGSSDPPLTAVGVAQAEATAARLLRLTDGGQGFAAVVSSPLRRARHTAEIAAAALGLDVHVEAGFRETAFGAWEGATYAEVVAGWPQELAAWHASIDVAPPGGESFADTERRVRAARDRLIIDFPGQRLLVVAHVSPIKVLTWLALGASPAALFRTSLDLASLTEVDWYPDGGSVLRRFNDAAHLED